MRTLNIVSLLLAVLFVGLGWSNRDRGAIYPIEPDLYEEVYQPFVLVSVHLGDEELGRGSGFLIKHVEDGACRVLAVTNHHVVYGIQAMSSDENVPDLGDAVVIVQPARKYGQDTSDVHLAEPLRTSRSADLSLLLVPHMACATTATATIAEHTHAVRVLTNVLHVTASGAEPGNIEIVPTVITRFGPDPMGHVTFSTNEMTVSGKSGSPVFVKTWGGYKVVGVVKSHYTFDGVNNAGTNYIATSEELMTLIGK
jgi:hypothetical protein